MPRQEEASTAADDYYFDERQRLEFKYRSLARDHRMVQSVRRIQKRMKRTVFQNKQQHDENESSTSIISSSGIINSSIELALPPPQIVNNNNNSTTTTTILMMAASARASVQEFISATIWFCRAVYRTIICEMCCYDTNSTTELQQVLRLFRGRLQETFVECRAITTTTTFCDDKATTTKDERGGTTVRRGAAVVVSLFAKKTKGILQSISSCIPYFFMTVWAGMLTFISTKELSVSVDRMRVSVREALVFVYCSTNLLVRLFMNGTMKMNMMIRSCCNNNTNNNLLVDETETKKERNAAAVVVVVAQKIRAFAGGVGLSVCWTTSILVQWMNTWLEQARMLLLNSSSSSNDNSTVATVQN